MENKLNKWFDAARHNPPMISAKEVGAMISNPPAVNGGFSTLTKFIFMGTLMLTIVSWLYWVNMDTPVENTIQNKKLNETTTHLTETQKQTLSPEHLTKKLTIVSADGSERAESRQSPLKSGGQNDVYMNLAGSGAMGLSDQVVTLQEEIILNNEELLKLGIRTNGNTLNYLNKYDMWSSSPAKADDYALAMVIEISKSGDIRSSNAHPDDSVLAKYSNPAIPLVITRLASHDEDDKGASWILDKHVPVTKKTIFVSAMTEKLIPVVVHTKGQGIKYVHDNTLVFWYKNNEAFRQQLPAGYKAKLEQVEDFSEALLSAYIQELTEQENYEFELSRLNDFQLKKKQEQYVVLTNKELKKLNIRFDGKSLFYKTTAPGTDNRRWSIRLNATPDNQMMAFTGETGKKKYSKKNPLSAWYVTDSNLSIISNFVDPVGDPGDQEASEQRMRDQQKLLKERVEHLCPILVSFSPDAVKKATNKHPVTYLVFWFPETAELKKMLNECKLDKSKASITLNGVNLLQLSDSSLGKLGVKRGKGEIEYHMSANLKSVLSNNGSTETFNSLTKEEYYRLPVEERGDSTKIILNNKTLQEYYLYAKKNLTPPIVPYLVSDESGKHWYMNSIEEGIVRLDSTDYAYMRANHIKLNDYPKYKEQKRQNAAAIIKKMSWLIPVKVFSTDKSFVIILWYEPTPNLFAVLPKAANDEYESIQNGKVPPTCIYFESCKDIRGTISQFVLYPNPTANIFQVEVELGEARGVNIYLTDITGKKVKEMAVNVTQEKGQRVYESSLAGLSEGMYLVHITTDKGEYIVQRLIKKE